MELDTKESELETIQLKLAHINLDTASLSSGTGDFNELVHHEETSLEGKQGFSFYLLFAYIFVCLFQVGYKSLQSKIFVVTVGKSCTWLFLPRKSFSSIQKQSDKMQIQH